MKISISHNLLNAISTQVSSIFHHMDLIEKTHPVFKNSIGTPPSANDIFTSFLKTKVSKMGTIVKTENSLDIEINDDFIIESNKTLRVSRNGVELSVPATDLAENDVILDESVLRRA